MMRLDSTPPKFLIVTALLATAVVVAVLVVIYRSVKREQRGFDVGGPSVPPKSVVGETRQTESPTDPR